MVLTDIAPKYIFNLFLLEATLDDELVIAINRTTEKKKRQNTIQELRPVGMIWQI